MIKGSKFSKETIEKIRKSHLGYKYSIEARQKMSNSAKGRVGYWRGKQRPLETRNKISIGHKGKKLSEETKIKMRGRTPWCKGKTGVYSEETLLKMSKARLGQKMHPNTKEAIRKAVMGNKFCLGKKLSVETRKKISEANKGDKCHLWRGGISKINRSERENFMSSIEYHLWHEACCSRDNWTCQKYKIKGGKLNVHHIYNYADYPELRTSIENGITLSKKAHEEFHNKYGRKNNTREQLQEFLTN
jgi:hypothetical protein